MSLKKKTLGEKNLTPMSRDDLNNIDDDDTGEVDFSEAYTRETSPVKPMRSAGNELSDTDIYEDDVLISKLDRAPDTWNFFRHLSDKKAADVMESILRLGLLNRIIIWETGENKFMILSGHNRVDIFNKLYEETEDPKFLKIPARIYKADSISESEAKEIIIDTNWAQRDLSPTEKSRSILEKVKIYKEKTKKDTHLGRTRDLVAEKHGIKGRMVANYIKLAQLIPEFADLLDDGILTIINGATLAGYSKEDQAWLYQKFGENWDKNSIKGIRSNMTRKELEALIAKNANIPSRSFSSKLTKIIVEVPYGREVEVTELLNKWKRDNDIPNEGFKMIVN